MNADLYRQYMQEYIQTAIDESDGTNTGIYEQLDSMKVTSLVTRHKEEKERALQDAKAAFDEHHHWPLQIILSQLGVNLHQEGGE